MAQSRLTRRNWAAEARQWYPLLVAAWPVLALFVANQDDVTLATLWRPLLLTMLGTALMLGLVRRVARDPHRAALLVTAGSLWVCLTGHLERLVRGSALHVLLDTCPWDALGAWLAGLAALLVLIGLTRRPLAPWTAGLSLAAAALVLWQVLAIGLYQWQLPRTTPGAADTALVSAGPKARRPSIYHLLLDGYARQDVLARVYGYDNGPFVRFLESRGFYVAARSRANYCQTDLSLASTLNGCYLDRVAAQLPPNSNYRDPLRQMVHDSKIARHLQPRGYRVVLLGDGDDGERPTAPGAGSLLAGPALNEFEQRLVAMLPVVANWQHGEELPPAAQLILGTLDQFDNERAGGQPSYVFAHVVCPHPPFVLPPGVQAPYSPADGDQNPLPSEQYIRFYRGQVQYLNGRVQASIDRLLSRVAPDSIVLITSDHGPASHLQWENPHPSQAVLQERLSNLIAVRVPGRRPAWLQPELTSVNLYPHLFREYLGDPWPLLPDESYFSTWGRPYQFQRVTDQVRGAPPR